MTASATDTLALPLSRRTLLERTTAWSLTWSAAGISPLAVHAAGPAAGSDRPRRDTDPGLTTVVTFGDSVLDCGHYNPFDLTPGGLLVRNDDARFPEFRGRDLSSHGPAWLDHRAVDGATSRGLAAQMSGWQRPASGRTIAVVSAGGNDLLQGLAADPGPGFDAFAQRLEDAVASIAGHPDTRVLVATVYDPTFGDDRANFLAIEPRIARRALERVNASIRDIGRRHGRVADLHAHFLRGDPSWFVHTIEPSATGASEIRRVLLDVLSI